MAKNRKSEVNGTELRQNLPTYLAEVKKGREIEVTSRGRVIARSIAGGDRLLAAREHCTVGDVVCPIGAEWDAER